jgi:hypothetical protein
MLQCSNLRHRTLAWPPFFVVTKHRLDRLFHAGAASVQ